VVDIENDDILKHDHKDICLSECSEEKRRKSHVHVNTVLKLNTFEQMVGSISARNMTRSMKGPLETENDIGISSLSIIDQSNPFST
jgi:hypothetical protein